MLTVTLHHIEAAMPFPLDRATPESVAAAKAATEQERLANGLDPATGLPPAATDDPSLIFEAMALTRGLIIRFGAKRVQGWVRNLAALEGQEL